MPQSQAAIVYFTLPESKVLTAKDRERKVAKIFTSVRFEDPDDLEQIVDVSESYLRRMQKEQPEYKWEIVHFCEVEFV